MDREGVEGIEWEGAEPMGVTGKPNPLTLLRGLDLPIPNCGCDGVLFPRSLRWYSPLEDLGLVGMCYALWLSVRKAGRPIDTSF